MAHMYERVKAIISKSPEERGIKEIQSLLPWFRKKSELFVSVKDDVLIDIVRNCEFCTPHRDFVIIKQGEKGDCFYIILKGKVSIFINNQISDEEDESKIAEKSKETDAAYKEGKELDRSKFGNYIAPIETGKSFGELALISKDCVRNASIIADETTDLLVVNRDLYNRSLKAAQVAEFEERTKFVTENPLFQNWAHKHKKQLAFSLRKLKFQFDSYIVKQGDKADVMYFLLKGQAKLMVEPQQLSLQYSSLQQASDAQDPASAEVAQLVASTKKHPSVSPIPNEHTLIITPSALRRHETVKKPIEMSIVGSKEIIGDTEFALDMNTYIQSVVCTQVTDVFALDMKNYERLVTKRNPKTIELLREGAELKLSSRVGRLQENTAPLLKSILQKLKNASKQPKRQHRQTNEDHLNYEFSPQRGPLIDLYGPGTVFYRNKMREKAKQAKLSKPQYRNATRFGLNAPAIPAATEMIDELDERLNRGYTNLLTDKNETFLTKAHEAVHLNEDAKALQKNAKGKGTFNDFESSDRALAVLEERIAAWHAAVVESNNKKPKTITKLHRVNIDDNKDLKPGKKIVLRRRKPGKPRVVFDGNSDENEEETLKNTTRRAKSVTEGFGHSDTDDSYDGCEYDSSKSGRRTTCTSKSPTRFIFRLKKKRTRRQYTAEEYAELKKTMVEKQRSLAKTLLTSSSLF